DTICQRIEEAFDTDDMPKQPFRDTFRDALESIFTFFLHRQDLLMILMKEAHRMLLIDDREKAAYFVGQRTRVVNSLQKPVEIAIQRGEIKPLPSIAIAHLIWGNISGVQMHLCIECVEGSPQSALLSTAAEAADFLTTT